MSGTSPQFIVSFIFAHNMCAADALQLLVLRRLGKDYASKRGWYDRAQHPPSTMHSTSYCLPREPANLA